MKITLPIALAATLVVSGCATAPAGPSKIAYDTGVDYDRVAAIDHTARVNGIEVHWVNMPQKKVPSTPVAPDLPTGT